MIVRRPAVLEEKDENDAVEVLELVGVVLVGLSADNETSDCLESVRARDMPPSLLVLLLADVGVVASCWITTPVGGRLFGGTSWTWRFSGWFDLEGGGRTNINVL
jgi:hypothetical protein